MQCSGYAQTARICQLLDTLCQYDPRTRYCVVGNDHFTEGDADAYRGLEIVEES